MHGFQLADSVNTVAREPCPTSGHAACARAHFCTCYIRIAAATCAVQVVGGSYPHFFSISKGGVRLCARIGSYDVT